MKFMSQNKALQGIQKIVGPKGWSSEKTVTTNHSIETRGMWQGHCDLVVNPANPKEVSDIVKICAEHSIPIVAQGGNTGLVGGGVPNGGIVLTTHKMNSIRNIDPLNNTISVDAGIILSDLQDAANSVDRLFPLSLGSEGSCQIGGNLSTNAGGVQVLRYGNTRDLVLGIEVVLPDGRILDNMNRLRKDNMGYDLKHLFIGGEGTLGIITGAVLKLFPKPKRTYTAFVGANNPEAILSLFSLANDVLGNAISAFEYLNQFALETVLQNMDQTSNPLLANYSAYALIEVSSFRQDGQEEESLEVLLHNSYRERSHY